MPATLDEVVSTILDRRRSLSPARSLLVAVTGIDGSGKGYVTSQIVPRLREAGLRAAGINLDGWLHLPEKRFSAIRPGEHFYEHAFRFDEMFAHFVLPLRDARSLRLEASLADPTNASAYTPHVYDFHDLDAIVLEGVFLLRDRYRLHFDLTVWVDCTFETALERAHARAQEGLPPEEMVRDYETIYFAAQKIHFERDEPREKADLIVRNDARLGGVVS